MSRKFLGWLTMLRNKSEIIDSFTLHIFSPEAKFILYLHFIIWEYPWDIVCTWPLFPHCYSIEHHKKKNLIPYSPTVL